MNDKTRNWILQLVNAILGGLGAFLGGHWGGN